MEGCYQSWGGNRQAGHIYKHILDECEHVDEEMKKKV